MSSHSIVIFLNKKKVYVIFWNVKFRALHCIIISSSNEDIIQLIREGSHDDIGTEKLRGLLKILPEIDECEMLKAFSGDVTKLGTAEKFLLQLIQLPK